VAEPKAPLALIVTLGVGRSTLESQVMYTALHRTEMDTCTSIYWIARINRCRHMLAGLSDNKPRWVQ
jgi:hypothetical protein